MKWGTSCIFNKCWCSLACQKSLKCSERKRNEKNCASGHSRDFFFDGMDLMTTIGNVNIKNILSHEVESKTKTKTKKKDWKSHKLIWFSNKIEYRVFNQHNRIENLFLFIAYLRQNISWWLPLLARPHLSCLNFINSNSVDFVVNSIQWWDIKFNWSTSCFSVPELIFDELSHTTYKHTFVCKCSDDSQWSIDTQKATVFVVDDTIS